jgi:hypothetical protein
MFQESDNEERTCAHKFKAASNAKCNDYVVDAGLVAGCCKHDIVLRFHNIPQTGERLQYAYRILLSILADPNCPQSLVIFYDINCKFSKYLKVQVAFTFN